MTKTMKKILTGTLALMLFVGAAQAQTKDASGPHHHGGHEKFAKELNLSADQQAKLKSIHEAQRKEMESLKTTSLTADQLKAQRQAIHQKYSEQAKTVYTPDQQAKLD